MRVKSSTAGHHLTDRGLQFDAVDVGGFGPCILIVIVIIVIAPTISNVP